MRFLSFSFLIILCLSAFFACKNNNDSSNKATNNTSNPTTTTTTTATAANDKKTILFFGNSLTAAYGLNVEQGFVNRLQLRIDSLTLPYKCVNAGLSGETTAAGKERVDWVLRQKVAIFVLELGGNDALRGLSPEESYKNLQSIIDQVRAKYPTCKIILAGMMAPPNMGKKYADAFYENYIKLHKNNNIALIPFLLDKVGGIKKLNQADGIHPTADGNLIMTETIWKTLKPLL